MDIDNWTISFIDFILLYFKAHLKQRRIQSTCQTPKIEGFAKIVNSFQFLTIFPWRSIFEIWHGAEYVPV